MQAKFEELVTSLSRVRAMPAAVATATCPRSARQIIPKLLDVGVPAEVLTRSLAEVFGYPVYDRDVHGALVHACKNGEWGYAAGILFVSCPFDGSLQPAVLLPPEAYRDFTGFGLLPVSGENADPGSDGYDRAQAEKTIRRWLERATARGATDLHVAPLTGRYVRVRARIDGQLQTLDEIPMSGEETSFRFISNMLLKMMNCATGSFIRPIDGRFEYQASGRRVDVRVAMRPVSVRGMLSQAFYLRLLGTHATDGLKSFSALGFSERVQAVFADVRRLSQGLVLMTGPTGSGKSMTLYANLARIVRDDPWRSVQTLEDPVEIDMRGIDQTQINEEAGMSFHEGLKALMRSDVDVILVGEVRDPETAKLTVRSSLTGHLVFATVHAKSALSVVERMLDLGVNAKALSLVLSAVFSQRLVRRVCSACSREVAFSDHETDGYYADLFSPGDRLRLANARGCASCDRGYRGRRVVTECVRVSRPLARAIAAGEGTAGLESLAAREDGETLWQNAASLVKRGETTLAECERHLSFRRGSSERGARANDFPGEGGTAARA